MEISVDLWELYKKIKKKYLYFYVPNRKKMTINAYKSMGRYNVCVCFLLHYVF